MDFDEISQLGDELFELKTKYDNELKKLDFEEETKIKRIKEIYSNKRTKLKDMIKEESEALEQSLKAKLLEYAKNYVFTLDFREYSMRTEIGTFDPECYAPFKNLSDFIEKINKYNKEIVPEKISKAVSDILSGKDITNVIYQFQE